MGWGVRVKGWGTGSEERGMRCKSQRVQMEGQGAGSEEQGARAME